MNKIKTKSRFFCIVAISMAILVLVMILSLALGSANISFKESISAIFSDVPFLSDILNSDGLKDTTKNIVLNIRLPRILLAGVIGASLSVCGAIYQSVLKNSMADPYTLGVSSGAALGATIAIILNGVIDVKIMAFITAMFTAIIVYWLSLRISKRSSTALILMGINANFLISAVISLLMIMNKDKMDKIVFWTMGSLATSTWTNLKVSLITIIPMCLSFFFGRQLNAISFNEELAKSVGINTAFIRKTMIVLVSVITAICVSVSGIIGFVGLMLPHVIRFIFGGDYRYLLPLSAIYGAVFLIISDDIAKTAAMPSEIPIGIVTSLIGAPFLIYLIFRNFSKSKY